MATILSSTTMRTSIELASAADVDEIFALQRLAYQSEAAIYPGCALPPLTETLEEVREDFARKTVLKATLDGRIIGAVRVGEQDGTCHISRLIVHPAHQNRGLGTRLMQAVEARFAQARRFELFTGHKSRRNLHLYAKLGYRVFKSVPRTPENHLIYLEKPGPCSGSSD